MADEHIDEIWRVILGYPTYEVSNLGRVRRITTGRILKNGRLPAWRNKNLPYARVGLSVRGTKAPKGFMVHKLVANAFVPNPDNKPCVNHINHDPFDARAANLEWCTHRENTMHAYLAGRLPVPHPGHGVHNHDAKLTDDDVRKIRKMSATGLSNARVAKVFGIDRSIVSRIKNGHSWKHVT